ncbi:MAG TPA: 3-oxoadipyl-CoA thiolase [Elusimicrobiales bacterium]|nr:3-oxoadipyl-CoA thiolase [Elusimicrobiales bacterium]
MGDAFICDAVRTPIGSYGGSLSTVRTDDLAAIPLKALLERNPGVDWKAVDDVILGCANQAGEDNRNVARMALLLAGLDQSVPGTTVNRLCGSGMDAVGIAARAIKAGEADLVIAGGVESMSRAPFVMAKASEPFSRKAEIFDTTIGWRFVNKAMAAAYGVDPLIMTAENVAAEYGVTRIDQDRFAHGSQQKAAQAQAAGLFGEEIIPVTITHPKKDPVVFARDEFPRLTSPEKLSKLKPVSRESGTVTAGNSSGINDGAAAMIVASGEAVKRYSLEPMAKITAMQTAGVAPRTMGMGPVPAVRKLLSRLGLTMKDIGLVELNEAFAAQALACLRELGLGDEDPRVNRLGGAIALGHPLGMSGARIVLSACRQMRRGGAPRALCAMCIGVGQGIAVLLEKP